MKIACDLDDCLVAVCKEVLDLVNERTGNNFEFEDAIGWKLEKTFGVPIEVVLPIVHEVLSRDYVPQIPGAIETLNYCYKTKAWKEFFIVTHRRPSIRESTEKLVNSLGLNFPFTLELVGENRRGVPAKAEYIQKHNIDILIEDRFDTAVDVVTNTKAAVLLINKPWNLKEHIPYELVGKLVRIYSWAQIGDYLNHIKLINELLEEANEETRTQEG